jgi:hypothetical protein
MVIDSRRNDSQSLFSRFKESLNFKRILNEKIKPSVDFRKLAGQIDLPDSFEFLDKIVSINPNNFLFNI